MIPRKTSKASTVFLKVDGEIISGHQSYSQCHVPSWHHFRQLSWFGTLCFGACITQCVYHRLVFIYSCHSRIMLSTLRKYSVLTWSLDPAIGGIAMTTFHTYLSLRSHMSTEPLDFPMKNTPRDTARKRAEGNTLDKKWKIHKNTDSFAWSLIGGVLDNGHVIYNRDCTSFMQ